MRKPYVKLGLDIDGVFADNVTAIHRFKNVDKPRGWLPDKWDWLSDVGLDNSVWNEAASDAQFWLTVPPFLDNVSHLRNFLGRVRLMNLADVDLVFVTARKQHNHTLAKTCAWLGKLGLDHSSVIISPKKGELAKLLNFDFYIDDNLENCLGVFGETGRKPYLLDRPYNRHNTVDEALRYHRVSTVGEMLDDVDKYIRIL